MGEWYTSTAVCATANRARDRHRLRFIDILLFINNHVEENKSRRLIGRVHWLDRFVVAHYILVHRSMELLILTEQEHSVSLSGMKLIATV